MNNPWFWVFIFVVIAVCGGIFYQRRVIATPGDSGEPRFQFVMVTSTTRESPGAFAERDGVLLKYLAKSSDEGLYVYGFGECNGAYSVGAVELSEQGFKYPLLLKRNAEAMDENIGDVFIDREGAIATNVTSTIAERGCRLSAMKKYDIE